jgi:hypothetical protein
MWRHVLCAVFVMAFSFGLVLADEIKGRIYKVDGDKVYVSSGADEKDPKAAKAYDVAKDVKIYITKKGEKSEVTGGLTGDAFKKIDAEKGKGVTITTKDGKVTEIVFVGGKKKAQ